jgi:hypothetical protein
MLGTQKKGRQTVPRSGSPAVPDISVAMTSDAGSKARIYLSISPIVVVVTMPAILIHIGSIALNIANLFSEFSAVSGYVPFLAGSRPRASRPILAITLPLVFGNILA